MSQLMTQAQSALDAGEIYHAEQLVRAALDASPEDARANHLLGLIFARQGRFDDAMARFERGLAMAPNDPVLLLSLSQVLRQLERVDDAIGVCERAISADPNMIPARFYMAMMLQETGRADDAAMQLRAILQIDPDHVPANTRLGIILLESGHASQALPHLQGAVTLNPDNLHAVITLARTYWQLDRVLQAERWFARAIEMQPQAAMLRGARSDALRLLGRYHEAEHELREACRLAPDQFIFLSSLCNVLPRVGKEREAIHIMEQAAESAPDHPDIYRHLAALYERLHRLNEAKRASDEAVRRKPDDLNAQLIRALAEARLGDREGARWQLEEIVRAGEGTAVHGIACIELAHLLDRDEDYDRAFELCARGQHLRSQQPMAARQQPEQFLREIELVRQWVTTERIQAWQASAPEPDGEPPIFLVGMMRSGTTITEQMLNAHPRLAALDELPLLANITSEVESVVGRSMSVPSLYGQLEAPHVQALRSMYRASVMQVLGEDAGRKRSVNKMPLDIVRLPMVRRLFPEAKVLVALRDPRDVVLSCFMQDFAPNSATVLTHTLEGAARLYKAVMDCWLTYRDVLGLEYIEIRYEDLVEDLAGSARQMIQFLDEPWDERVLEFRQSAGAKYVSSASYMAVKEPIYTRARQRWRHYESHLKRVLPVLQPYVEAFGYAE